MDVIMRRENGIDVAATIMSETPCPIVIVTGCDTSDPKLAYRALQAGALEVVPKLPAPHASDYDDRGRELRRLLRNVAQIPVVHRRRKGVETPPPQAPRVRPIVAKNPKLVVIGASTGGPVQVRELLAALPANIPVPIALAQHIARGFGRGFADWLAETTGKRTRYVDKRLRLTPGTVYVAPDDGDLLIDGPLHGTPQPPCSDRGTPNVDVLFRSAADVLGPRVVAVLMTGMGSDGAAGIQALHKLGATTLAQEPSTCAVSAMPDAAIRAGAVSAVVKPAEIPAALEKLLIEQTRAQPSN
jgi:two-component system chemotaxis response regulator CheB